MASSANGGPAIREDSDDRVILNEEAEEFDANNHVYIQEYKACLIDLLKSNLQCYVTLRLLHMDLQVNPDIDWLKNQVNRTSNFYSSSIGSYVSAMKKCLESRLIYLSGGKNANISPGNKRIVGRLICKEFEHLKKLNHFFRTSIAEQGRDISLILEQIQVLFNTAGKGQECNEVLAPFISWCNTTMGAVYVEQVRISDLLMEALEDKTIDNFLSKNPEYERPYFQYRGLRGNVFGHYTDSSQLTVVDNTFLRMP